MALDEVGVWWLINKEITFYSTFFNLLPKLLLKTEGCETALKTSSIAFTKNHSVFILVLFPVF